jgi:hypothetical protein
MSATLSRRWIAILGILIVGAGIGFFLWSRSGKAPDQKPSGATSQPAAPVSGAGPPQNSSGQTPAIVAALAYLDLHAAELPSEKTASDYARELGNDPERLQQEVQRRVALVPYEGSLSDPVRLFQSGVANSLDRARLLQTLLKASGTEARIVSVDQDGKRPSAQYAATNPSILPVMKPDALTELGKEVEDLSPKILAALKVGADGTNMVGARPERRLYWVQYQRAGSWTDLIPSDITMDPAKRQTAQPLSDTALSGLVWQIKLRVVNSVAQKEKEVLSFSGAASELSGVPLTYLNQPDGSLKKFRPRLLYSDKSQMGSSFELADQGLDYQLLKLDIVGPYEHRHFTRTLVFPKDDANQDERGLEVATAARITVVCGPVSDEQFQRSLMANLGQAGKVLFGKAQDQNSAPLNPPSLPAIAVLDASQRYAGHSGAGGRVLAFQGRPAVVVEHDFVQASDKALLRRHSFDLVDPGHALYAADASPETLAQAAIEQSAVDAWLEDRVAQGDNLLTSRRAVRSLLEAKATINLTKSPAALESENYGALRPAYRLGRVNQGTGIAGWRFDPGPQAVPVLGNLTGGTQADMAQRARVQKLCSAIGWGQMVVPATYFPQKFLFSGIVSYDCKLAETYNKVSDRLDAAFAPLNGGAPDSGSGADIQKQIEQLGPDLIKDVVKNAITQAGAGLAIHGIKHYLTPAEESAVRPFSERQDPGALDNALSAVANSPPSGQTVDAIEQQAARALPQ